MKNILSKIVLIGIIGFSIISCGLTKKQKSKDLELSTSMKITCNIENGKFYQIDSIMVADTLPSLDKWLYSTYIDYSTNKKIVKRMYIRTYDEKREVVYVITGETEPYKITKRITE